MKTRVTHLRNTRLSQSTDQSSEPTFLCVPAVVGRQASHSGYSLFRRSIGLRPAVYSPFFALNDHDDGMYQNGWTYNSWSLPDQFAFSGNNQLNPQEKFRKEQKTGRIKGKKKHVLKQRGRRPRQKKKPTRDMSAHLSRDKLSVVIKKRRGLRADGAQDCSKGIKKLWARRNEKPQDEASGDQGVLFVWRLREGRPFGYQITTALRMKNRTHIEAWNERLVFEANHWKRRQEKCSVRIRPVRAVGAKKRYNRCPNSKASQSGRSSANVKDGSWGRLKATYCQPKTKSPNCHVVGRDSAWAVTGIAVVANRRG